jgi:hypothetical protein
MGEVLGSIPNIMKKKKKDTTVHFFNKKNKNKNISHPTN